MKPFAPGRYNYGVIWVAALLGIGLGPVLVRAADRWCPTPATGRDRWLGALVLAGALTALAARLPAAFAHVATVRLPAADHLAAVVAAHAPAGHGPLATVPDCAAHGVVTACGATPLIVTACYFPLACLGLVLARVDLAALRLPDGLVLPAYPMVGVPLILVAPGGTPRALLAATSCLIGYAALCAAGGLGFGDVKLGGVLGLATGWVSWRAVVAAVLIGLCCGAAHAVARRLPGNRGPVPYGPAMLAGALAALTIPW
ncbi:A24 family peptidase [Longispora sp. K20-0274]|uniref:prepilin peptidase n=1 Tax=Longispora sp. K20-0274 TaxID=3088255 RepID=UPI00399A5C01